MIRTAEERAILRQAADIRKRSKAPRQKIQPTAAGQRQPRERDNGFLAFLRRLPCVAGVVEGGCSGPIEAAHVRYSDAKCGRINPGRGAKPSDRWATPLCNHHHQHDQHTGSERAFWKRLGIDPGELCPALYAAYLAGQDGAEVIRAFAANRG